MGFRPPKYGPAREHGAMAQPCKKKIDGEILEVFTFANHSGHDCRKAGDVPLSAVEVEEDSAQRSLGSRPEQAIEGLVGREDPQFRVEDQSGSLTLSTTARA